MIQNLFLKRLIVSKCFEIHQIFRKHFVFFSIDRFIVFLLLFRAYHESIMTLLILTIFSFISFFMFWMFMFFYLFELLKFCIFFVISNFFIFFYFAMISIFFVVKWLLTFFYYWIYRFVLNYQLNFDWLFLSNTKYKICIQYILNRFRNHIFLHCYWFFETFFIIYLQFFFIEL